MSKEKNIQGMPPFVWWLASLHVMPTVEASGGGWVGGRKRKLKAAPTIPDSTVRKMF